VRGPIAGYAAQLQTIIANRQQELAQRNVRGRSAPELGASAAPARAPVKQNMAVRSAYGLAATLAAVGFVAPAIGERAVPEGASPMDAPASGASPAPMSMAATQTTAAQTTRVEPASASALDLWLTTGSVTEAEAAPAPAEAPAQITPATADAAAPVQFTVLSLEAMPMPVLTIGKADVTGAGPTVVVMESDAVARDKRSHVAEALKPATLAGTSGADAATAGE
jgi:hypothetical protein